jgi:hypothetical protein
MESQLAWTGPSQVGVLAAAAAATIAGVVCGPDCAAARRGTAAIRANMNNAPITFVVDDMTFLLRQSRIKPIFRPPL